MSSNPHNQTYEQGRIETGRGGHYCQCGFYGEIKCSATYCNLLSHRSARDKEAGRPEGGSEETLKQAAEKKGDFPESLFLSRVKRTQRDSEQETKGFVGVFRERGGGRPLCFAGRLAVVI